MPLNRNKAPRYLTSEPEDEVSLPTKVVYERVFLTRSSPELDTLERGTMNVNINIAAIQANSR